MEFGCVLPHNEIGTDPQAIKAWAQGVEALGATHMLIYDHVLGADRDRSGGFEGPYDKDIAFHEPFTTFAFLAGVTQSIDFVTTVLVLPQRQTALVAKQVAQLAILSSNRFRLGIGTGWNQVEYEALNEDFDNRGKRQEEQVELMRALWADETVSFDGKYHRVTKAGINPRPSAPVPIWFGGGAPALLKRCARMGDGWMPVMGANQAAADALALIETERQSRGLTMDGFGVQAQAQFAGGTVERWRSHAMRWRDLGATHLAVATHNAEPTDADGHVARVAAYLDAVKGL
jgi:probable F420-dependent oxidoreductase